MGQNFDRALAEVLKHEGGYVNHPDDPGGMTNLGVTRAAWSAYKGRGVSEDEMRGLTVEKVKPFYRDRYWAEISGDWLPDGVDYAVFDFAVNSGVGRAARCLQSLVNVSQDGRIGPKTIAAVKDEDPVLLVNELCAERLKFLKGLATFRTFGRGWTKRVTDVQARAAEMAG